jgi:hypothetical protein
MKKIYKLAYINSQSVEAFGLVIVQQAGRWWIATVDASGDITSRSTTSYRTRMEAARYIQGWMKREIARRAA